jgi:hypothetical protein
VEGAWQDANLEGGDGAQGMSMSDDVMIDGSRMCSALSEEWVHTQIYQTIDTLHERQEYPGNRCSHYYYTSLSRERTGRKYPTATYVLYTLAQTIHIRHPNAHHYAKLTYLYPLPLPFFFSSSSFPSSPFNPLCCPVILCHALFKNPSFA